MRYIPNSIPPANGDWLGRAQAVLDRLNAAADDDARADIIDEQAALYRELRDWLLEKSHGKCWFSEAKELFSHFDVEHYRPKKKARDGDGGDCTGYWWLAFDWRNFRICGNVGNRKKGTFFPLKTGCTRATADRRCLDDEQPSLLDPSDAADPGLIDFDEEGRIRPSAAAITDWEKERVRISVERYRLDYEPLEDERKKIWYECAEKLRDCNEALANAQQQNSEASRAKVKVIMAELRKMCAEAAPLSRVARNCLLASGVAWATQLVSSN